jgi:hypothetical protein
MQQLLIATALLRFIYLYEQFRKLKVKAEGRKRKYTIFEVFRTATMKKAVFWEMTPCGCVLVVS